MLPRLAFTGMAMLPKALALSALSKSFRLRWRKPSRACASWQKTLTTFCPSMISSM